MTENIVVLVTVASPDEGEAIARKVVRAKLAACVNIIAGVRSIFNWQGEICEEAECQLVIKSTIKGFDRLAKMIKEAHSYDVPEIIALPIVTGAADYLAWLSGQVKPGEKE